MWERSRYALAPIHSIRGARSLDRLWGLLVALVLLLTGCTGRGAITPPPVTLRIAGSSSMTPLLADLAQAYQARHPHVLVDLQTGGSAVGLAELQAGRINLAAVSWQRGDATPPKGFQVIPVARDAVAIIVHPRNSVPGLTLLRARAIFRGDTTDWGALGGADGEPVVISREDGSGTRAAFEAQVMAGDHVTLNALVMPTSRAVVDYVATHRAAIGYVSSAWLDDRVRAVAVEDTMPDSPAIRSGAYHLARTLYLYAPNPAPPNAQAFIDFILSPAGQAIVAQRHVVLR